MLLAVINDCSVGVPFYVGFPIVMMMWLFMLSKGRLVFWTIYRDIVDAIEIRARRRKREEDDAKRNI